MFRPREGYLQVFSGAHSEVQAGEFCVVWLRPLATHEWSALKRGIQLTFIQSVWYCACPERLRGSKTGFQLLDIWLFEQEIVCGHTFVGFNEPGGSFIIGTVKCSSISRVKLSTQCLELRFYTLNKWVTEMYPVLISVLCLLDWCDNPGHFISIWISSLTLLLWNLSS